MTSFQVINFKLELKEILDFTETIIGEVFLHMSTKI